MAKPDAYWLGVSVVPAEVLDAEGQTLEDLFGEPVIPNPDAMRWPAPDTGWRVISGRLPDEVRRGRDVVVAAPWQHAESPGWMMLRVHRGRGSLTAGTVYDDRPAEPFIDPATRWPTAVGLLDVPWRFVSVTTAYGSTAVIETPLGVLFSPGRDRIHVKLSYQGNAAGTLSWIEPDQQHATFGNWATVPEEPAIPGGTYGILSILDGPVEFDLEPSTLTFTGVHGSANLRLDVPI